MIKCCFMFLGALYRDPLTYSCRLSVKQNKKKELQIQRPASYSLLGPKSRWVQYAKRKVQPFRWMRLKASMDRACVYGRHIAPIQCADGSARQPPLPPIAELEEGVIFPTFPQLQDAQKRLGGVFSCNVYGGHRLCHILTGGSSSMNSL